MPYEILFNFAYSYPYAYKKQVFQLFENLKINVTQHIFFLLNIKYLAGSEKILMGGTC